MDHALQRRAGSAAVEVSTTACAVTGAPNDDRRLRPAQMRPKINRAVAAEELPNAGPPQALMPERAATLNALATALGTMEPNGRRGGEGGSDHRVFGHVTLYKESGVSVYPS